MLTFATALIAVTLANDVAAGARSGSTVGTGNDWSARVAFVSGQSLFRADKFAEAAVQFERAYELKPHAAIWFNIARCYEELGNAPLALRAYRLYLEERRDAADRDVVKSSIAILERKLKVRGTQQLMVRTDPAEATIFIDDSPRGHSPLFVELAPGEHRVRVEHSGLQTLSRTVTMSASTSSSQSFVLQPPTVAMKATLQ